MGDLKTAMQKWPLQTTAYHAPWLFGLALDAPLMGVLKRWPDKLHAITQKAVIHGSLYGRGKYESACGLKGLRLVGGAAEGEVIAAPWPPRLKGLPKEKTRCQDCYEATGRLRPRCNWASRSTPT